MPRTEAQQKGKFCENRMDVFLKQKCPILLPLVEGADRLCIKSDGSIELWEAKYGTGKLTPKQRMVKNDVTQRGISYNEFRCKIQPTLAKNIT